jgi:UDP-glucuronate 4-epimerase|tara:strand:+ start:254 stop:1225 length:972 start_codon:yes stop_codon:yes gene_type:complete
MGGHILVTGGAGFIGSHVCERLISSNEKVICLDNFNDFYNPQVKEDNIKDIIKNPNFKLYRASITDFDKVKDIFNKNKIDKIIHLAARAGVRPSFEDPWIYQETNIKGTLNILKLAKDFGIKNFISSSSSSVYGTNTEVPFSETMPTDNPVSVYAATKKSAEILCRAYHNNYDMNITVLRLFTVYGPRGRPDMAPHKFTEKIFNGEEIEVYGDGTSKRDYTYIKDVIDGIVAAKEKNFGFEIINLGNSKPIELKKFISIIENCLGKKAKIKQVGMQMGDVPITYANISKAKKLLNYSPKVDIEEGIKLFAEWFIKSKQSKKND